METTEEVSVVAESTVLLDEGPAPKRPKAISENRKYIKLPIARVKHIMKMDTDCTIISKDAAFLVTKATELFLEALGRATVVHTKTAKRKTILKRDIDAAIESTSNLCFLEGALE